MIPIKIGLIDVDGHHFPNLALMKISTYHKRRGDIVEWYSPMFSEKQDVVYMSKVFTFTQDFEYFINADKVIMGGTGYNLDNALPPEIERCYPDYRLYGIDDTAYGFLTRGCPRNCAFCIVSQKEGQKSYQVADVSQFWIGQKNIEIMDPNILACPNHEKLLKQLIDTKALVNFNQGLDVRFLTEKNVRLLMKIRMKIVHFAWDNPKDENIIVPKLEWFKKVTGWGRSKISVYVLTNFNSTFEQDLKRVYTLRAMGIDPYITIYEKEKLPKGHKIIKLQRWVNNRFLWGAVPTFDEYLQGKK